MCAAGGRTALRFRNVWNLASLLAGDGLVGRIFSTTIDLNQTGQYTHRRGLWIFPGGHTGAGRAGARFNRTTNYSIRLEWLGQRGPRRGQWAVSLRFSNDGVRLWGRRYSDHRQLGPSIRVPGDGRIDQPGTRGWASNPHGVLSAKTGQTDARLLFLRPPHKAR